LANQWLKPSNTDLGENILRAESSVSEGKVQVPLFLMKIQENQERSTVYRYPAASGSLDSLDGYAKSTIIFPWLNFELNEKVTVVFNKVDPSKSHIFSLGIFFTDTLLILLSLYMVKLGVTRRDS